MIRIPRCLLAIATLLVVTVGGASQSEATPIQLFSPGELSLFDVRYDYPPRTVAGTQPVVPSPLIVSGPGNVLTFTEAGGAFVRMDQEPSVPSAGGWFGTFAAGTRVVYTGNNADPDWFGPITVTFAVPLIEFGLFAQFSDEFFPGPFLFTVFNGAMPLSTFSRGVTSLPSFLGARSSDAEITSLLIRGPSSLALDNDFAIGPITSQAVPEPSTLVLLGGALAAAFRARRRHRGDAPRVRRPERHGVRVRSASNSCAPGERPHHESRNDEAADERNPERRINAGCRISAGGGMPYWITLDASTEQKLREWVRNSSRIQHGHASQNPPDGGAV